MMMKPFFDDENELKLWILNLCQVNWLIVAEHCFLMGAAAGILQDASVQNVTAFTAASKKITEEMIASGGGLSYERALELLNMYEQAFLTVNEYFPGAEVGVDILTKADQVLLAHGCDSENTLYAQSVCPDEINHEDGDITELFSKRMGEVFHMGGLAGIPFTGKTGFAAFSHHVPDNGNLFILFAPHIGLSSTSKLGKFTRKGQCKDGTACGAACGALSYCLACRDPPPPLNNGEVSPRGNDNVKRIPVPGQNPSDYQMEYIISEVNKRLETIMAGASEDAIQANLAMEMYNIAKENIEHVIGFESMAVRPTLYILGGIQINMPSPMKDFFMPCMFEARMPDGETIDLMESSFGSNLKKKEQALAEQSIKSSNSGNGSGGGSMKVRPTRRFVNGEENGSRKTTTQETIDVVAE